VFVGDGTSDGSLLWLFKTPVATLSHRNDGRARLAAKNTPSLRVDRRDDGRLTIEREHKITQTTRSAERQLQRCKTLDPAPGRTPA